MVRNQNYPKSLYNILFHQCCNVIYHHKWIHGIKEVLISAGRFDLFSANTNENPKFIKRQISEALIDLHIQNWHTKVLKFIF